MRTVTIILLISLFAACKQRSKKETSETPPVTKTDSVVSNRPDPPRKVADTVFYELSKKILTSIKAKDYAQLARFAHPVRGIRFSPYGYIDTNEHIILLEKNIVELAQTGQRRNWGSYDGTGDSILLSLEGYFKRFVYDADFLNPKEKSVNRFLGGGNSVNNLETIYPGCDFTEFYFPGLNPIHDGMDWRSLRLVFKQEGSMIYLVGVVHDEWTI